jgi:hypothetical protein
MEFGEASIRRRNLVAEPAGSQCETGPDPMDHDDVDDVRDEGIEGMKKNILVVMAMVAGLLLSSMSMALAQPTTVNDNASEKACFGQWRASSVQQLTDDGYVVGRDFFSQRKGDNASINADNKAECAPAE